MFTVYSHRDAADQIIYVGQTRDLAARTRAHARRAAWWSQVARVAVEAQYPGRGLAMTREANLIRTRRPANNCYGSRASEELCYQRSLAEALGGKRAYETWLDDRCHEAGDVDLVLTRRRSA